MYRQLQLIAYVVILGSAWKVKAEESEDMDEDERLLHCAVTTLCLEEWEKVQECQKKLPEEEIMIHLGIANKLVEKNYEDTKSALAFVCELDHQTKLDLAVEYIPEFLDKFTVVCRDEKNELCVGYKNLFDCGMELITKYQDEGLC